MHSVGGVSRRHLYKGDESKRLNPFVSTSAKEAAQDEHRQAEHIVLVKQIREVILLRYGPPGCMMDRKEMEGKPAVAGAKDRKEEKQPAVAGARLERKRGSHRSQVQGIQKLRNGPPQAGIGTHGPGAE